MRGNRAEEGSHLLCGCHSQHDLLQAKGRGVVMHVVSEPCIPSVFPLLWEDKATGITFSLGTHTPNEITFASICSPAVFSFWQLFNDPYCVFPLGLQVTQTSLSPSTTPMVQINFWPKVFANSQIDKDKWRITLLKPSWLGTLWSRVWMELWTNPHGCSAAGPALVAPGQYETFASCWHWNQWLCLWHEILFKTQQKPWHTWMMSSLPSLLIFTWCSSRLAKFPESMVKIRSPSLLSLYRTCKLP